MQRHKFHKTMTKRSYNVRTVPVSHFSPSSDQRFLQFHTWSACFTLKPGNASKPLGGRFEHTGKGLRMFCMFDGEGKFAGSIVPWEGLINQYRTLQKLIAVSETRPFTRHEVSIWDHFATAGREGTEWYLYHVMLLQYEDEKEELMATRAGLGKVSNRAYDHSVARDRPTHGQKQWKEIILG